jgi:hypothetical protein
MIPNKIQFSEKVEAGREQRAVDAQWAKEQWEAKGGDKAAHTFKPDFKGQSYEQQMRDKKKK